MTPTIRKMDSFYFRIFPFLLMAIFLTVVPLRLSLMQTDGLLSFGAAFVTALFAMTGLMYARARAVTDAEEMKNRAEVADECLKAAFMAVMGFGVTSYIFLGLSDSYCPYTGPMTNLKDFNADGMPLLAAFLCTAIFAVPTVVKVNQVVDLTVKNMGLKTTKPD